MWTLRLCRRHWSYILVFSTSCHPFPPYQVEWMSDKLMRCFEDKRNNPFQFRHLSLCHGLSDLARVPSPKVVLASQPDLECGFSRDLFIQWCQDPKNSIILTYRTTPGTLARFLIDNPSEKITEIEVSACMWTFVVKPFGGHVMHDAYKNQWPEIKLEVVSRFLWVESLSQHKFQSSLIGNCHSLTLRWYPLEPCPEGSTYAVFLIPLKKVLSASFP